MTSLAKQALKAAVLLLQVRVPVPTHFLGSAASLAAGGHPLPLHHPACQAVKVVSHHQTL
jgi:hypothetical protein